MCTERQQEIELEISTDGKIRTIYKDELMDLIKEVTEAHVTKVARASNIEWEEVDGRRGWVVRSAGNPELAIRLHPETYRLWKSLNGKNRDSFSASDWCNWVVSVEGVLVNFEKREDALKVEQKRFWQLLPQKEQ